MSVGQKWEIKPLSEILDPNIDRIPAGNMAQLLGISRRQLRRIAKCLRDVEVDGFDHQAGDKRFTRNAAEVIWEFHQRLKLDGLEKALLQILGIEENGC
jgi:hypothetical protein